MSVGILLVTHGRVGQSLLDTANSLLTPGQLAVRSIPVPVDCDIRSVHEQINANLSKLDQGDGVLILTDIYGATPCNITVKFAERPKTRILTGVNLPMLIRVYNYCKTSDLDTLADIALEGARNGVMDCFSNGKE